MLCDNLFCIYWSGDRCTLDEISLDLQGRCNACIYVDLSEEVLARARDAILRQQEEDYRSWHPAT